MQVAIPGGLATFIANPFAMRFRSGLLLAALAGLMLLSSCGWYTNLHKKNTDLKGKKEVFVCIPSDANFDTVKAVFSHADVLIDPVSFDKAARSKSYNEHIKPGRYRITGGMTNKDLINLLKSGRQTPVKVSFHYVRTLAQFCGKISHKIEADSLSLLTYLENETVLKQKYGMDKRTVATLFLPNTYEFYWNTSAEEFTDKMYAEYKKFWSDERRKKADALGMDPVQVSILASIVQAEQSKFKEEWPRIAGVYINRLNTGMLLQSDPTVIFATGDFTIKRVLFRHLEIDSPYNTYKYPGLPPGPILIPEPEAIDAVLDYEKHEYIYMCAKDDLSGHHNFAKTLNEHNYNANLYQKALNKAGIR